MISWEQWKFELLELCFMLTPCLRNLSGTLNKIIVAKKDSDSGSFIAKKSHV